MPSCYVDRPTHRDRRLTDLQFRPAPGAHCLFSRDIDKSCEVHIVYLGIQQGSVRVVGTFLEISVELRPTGTLKIILKGGCDIASVDPICT